MNSFPPAPGRTSSFLHAEVLLLLFATVSTIIFPPRKPFFCSLSMILQAETVAFFLQPLFGFSGHSCFCLPARRVLIREWGLAHLYLGFPRFPSSRSYHTSMSFFLRSPRHWLFPTSQIAPNTPSQPQLRRHGWARTHQVFLSHCWRELASLYVPSHCPPMTLVYAAERRNGRRSPL